MHGATPVTPLSARLRNTWTSLSAFYLFIIIYPDVLDNLENENELLASMDINPPVRSSTNNTVIESEVSEKVSDKNTKLSRKVNRYLLACQPPKLTRL